jgi:hypothetical protein
VVGCHHHDRSRSVFTAPSDDPERVEVGIVGRADHAIRRGHLGRLEAGRGGTTPEPDVAGGFEAGDRRPDDDEDRRVVGHRSPLRVAAAGVTVLQAGVVLPV